jgi:predicted ATP-grasp superfamily ATP-dependent carboligase
MVEYRHDPATGRSVLMEINGRFWGSFPLAVASGAGFARFAHAAALGEPMPDLPAPRTDLRCRMVAAEIKRLLRLWLHPGLIADRTFSRRPTAETWRFIADFLRPRVRYYVWSLDDPLPSWRDLTNGLLRRS